MSAHVLVTGSLFRAPEQRTSKTGKTFVMATVKVKDGEGSQFWRVFAFSDALGGELMRLKDGDAISVQGSLKAELYDKGDGPKVSLTVMADQALALKQPPKQRDPKPSPEGDNRSKQERTRGYRGLGDPDDSIPF